jgi:hypothetical protein
MEKEAVETEIVDVETDHPTELTPLPLNSDHATDLIKFAKTLPELEKAQEAIIGFLIRRSYDGDWVSFSKSADATEDRTASPNAAACERFAAACGVQERNWKGPVKEWSEDRKHYTYNYEAEFSIGGRWQKAIGQAGTRDVFFTKAYGGFKPMEDVREDHIKNAAFRNCRKNGVRALLGLRSVPIPYLEKLGFKATSIRHANFKENEKATSAQARAEVKSGVVKMIVADVSEEKIGRGNTPFYVIKDKANSAYFLHGGANHPALAPLRAALKSGTMIEVEVKTENNYKNIEKVITQGA